MDQTQVAPHESVVVAAGYEMDESQKAVLMAPMLKAMREEVLKQELFDQIETQVPNPHPVLSEEKTTEQITFGMLAHVKYGLPISECITIVNDGQAINWCFDKFFNSEDFKKATDAMSTIDVGGSSISHNVDTNDINQLAGIMEELINKFNKDLKNSPVVFQKMNYANIKAKKLLSYGQKMTGELMFQVGCAVMAWRYYEQDLDEGIELAMKGDSAKKCFELFMKATASEIIDDMVGKTEETVVH